MAYGIAAARGAIPFAGIDLWRQEAPFLAPQRLRHCAQFSPDQRSPCDPLRRTALQAIVRLRPVWGRGGFPAIIGGHRHGDLLSAGSGTPITRGVRVKGRGSAAMRRRSCAGGGCGRRRGGKGSGEAAEDSRHQNRDLRSIVLEAQRVLLHGCPPLSFCNVIHNETNPIIRLVRVRVNGDNWLVFRGLWSLFIRPYGTRLEFARTRDSVVRRTIKPCAPNASIAGYFHFVPPARRKAGSSLRSE
jgi:hypothetical protein